MTETLMNVVTALAVSIITGAVTILVAYLQSKIKSDRINSSLSRLENVTNATVCELKQEFVDKWKESGKLTNDQVAELKALSLKKVKTLLDDPAAKLIESVGMDFNGLIQALVEKAVVGLRPPLLGEAIEIAEFCE